MFQTRLLESLRWLFSVYGNDKSMTTNFQLSLKGKHLSFLAVFSVLTEHVVFNNPASVSAPQCRKLTCTECRANMALHC